MLNEEILKLWNERREPLERTARDALHTKWMMIPDFYKLYVLLNQEQRELLGNYISKAAAVYLGSIDEAFVIGFKKGMRLALEAISDDEELKTERSH